MRQPPAAHPPRRRLRGRGPLVPLAPGQRNRKPRPASGPSARTRRAQSSPGGAGRRCRPELMEASLEEKTASFPTGGNELKEVIVVTKDIRWRIITLQVVIVLVLGFCAGFLFWGSSFVNGMVHDQLAAQQITFPARDSAAIKALPAGDATAMQQYAGQQMTTGAQAEVYA